MKEAGVLRRLRLSLQINDDACRIFVITHRILKNLDLCDAIYLTIQSFFGQNFQHVIYCTTLSSRG